MAKRQSKRKQKFVSNASFDYKEQVASALMEGGVPLRVAEVAVIDLRHEVNLGFHGKRSPRETAFTMRKTVDQIYKTNDEWHYRYNSPRSIVRNAVVSKTSNVGSIPTEGANMKMSYDQLKKYIKLSKSEQKDNGPYDVAFDTDWYNITDSSGVVVGQMTKEQYSIVRGDNNPVDAA